MDHLNDEAERLISSITILAPPAKHQQQQSSTLAPDQQQQLLLSFRSLVQQFVDVSTEILTQDV